MGNKYHIGIMTVEEVKDKILKTSYQIRKMKKMNDADKGIVDYVHFRNDPKNQHYYENRRKRMVIDIQSEDFSSINDLFKFCFKNGINSENVDDYVFHFYDEFDDPVFSVNSIERFEFLETQEECDQRNEKRYREKYKKDTDRIVADHNNRLKTLQNYLTKLENKLKYLEINNFERG